MVRKIDKITLEEIKFKCYEVALLGIIDISTMRKVKEVAENYLNNNGYENNQVKCDFENNSSEVIDRNHLIVEIYEVEFTGSSSYYKHLIIL